MSKSALSVMFLIASFSSAYALGEATKTYCAYDYMRYCSAYDLKSPDLGKCMANVGVNLSRKCINALVDDKLITKEEVIARAAKQGVVVKDSSNGLYVTGETVVATTEMPKETVKVQDAPLVEDKNEVGAETRKAIQGIPGAISSAISGAGNATAKTGSDVTKGVTKTIENVKKTVKKDVTAVKNQYNKITKSNTDYAKRPNIVEQNKLRNEYNGITSEGGNADFGRYEARRPGFTLPTAYNFKKRMESGEIYSSGVNGY